MTITTREKEVPTHLPAARLYLEDIEEIREILLEAAATRITLQKPELSAPHKIGTNFVIGNQVCTEVQELPKIGKSTRNFEMRLAAQDGFAARFGADWVSTQWTTEGLTKADTWRAFHRLEVVFERRKILWKSLLPRDPASRMVLLVAFTSLVLLPLVYRIGMLSVRVAFLRTELGSYLIVVPIVGLLVLMAIPVLRHSTVVFRYSWDQAAQREDRRTKIIVGTVTALIGALLGVAGTLLGLYFRHKYWP